jgi:DNA-binding transcriptional LysR family regulator
MPLKFTLRQLEYFVAVGETGSIAAASERVNVSPPSISASISQLEEEFGIQLFIRHHAQGLSLTPGGRRFFNEGRLILDQAEAMHELASDIAERARGPLNIGCLVTLAPLVLASLRRSFEDRYPNARVGSFVGHQAKLIEMLHRAEIDVAITYDLQIPQDVEFASLAELPPYVLVASDHALAGCDSVTLERLASEPMVLLDLPLSREYFLSLFQERNLRPVIAERCEDMAVLRSLVASGYGYALANIRPLTDLAPNGEKLRNLRLEGDFRRMALGLAMIATERRSRIVSAFLEHCEAQVSNEKIPGMAPPP